MEPTRKLEKEMQNLSHKFRLLQLVTYRPRESAAFNLPSSDKLIRYLKLQNLMAEGMIEEQDFKGNAYMLLVKWDTFP